MRLSAAQVYALARQAGFPPDAARTMTAIAKGESGFRTDAYNGQDRDRSYGLWQINMLGQMGVNRAREYGISSYDALFDPLQNAQAAYKVWVNAGRSFRPWSVYTNGTYQGFMAEATQAAQQVGDDVSAFTPEGTDSFSGDGRPLTKEELADRVREQFPAYAWLLDQPEVGELLLEAVDPNTGFDAETMQARLMQTEWWQNNAVAIREWDTLANTDPATAEQRIAQTAQAIMDRARLLGVDVPERKARELALTYNRFGWQGEFGQREIDRALLGTWDAGEDGSIAAIRNTLQAQSRQYLVPLGDATINKWAEELAIGTKDQNGFAAFLSSQAKALFPHLAPQLDTGVTPQDFLAPYMQVAQNVLGLNPSSMNPNDTRWLAPLNVKGENRVMTLDEWEQTLRTDDRYGWTKTKQAKNEAYEVGLAIARAMGKRR